MILITVNLFLLFSFFRAEGEPAKKRLRIHAEVSRPSVVRQVIPPVTHASQTVQLQVSHVSQHQVVKPQVSQHQLIQTPNQQVNKPQVSQHQTPQVQLQVCQLQVPQLPTTQHLSSQHHSSQLPTSQHSASQHSPSQNLQQSHGNVHQVCQTSKASLQTLATVTPVHVSHPPPLLMPVSSPHHPSSGVHIQPSVQIQNVSKPGPVSKPLANIPLATVTVSTPKVIILLLKFHYRIYCFLNKFNFLNCLIIYLRNSSY